jgi:ABC-type transport system involved in cytochrome c biogenesis permease subunit
MIKKIIIVTVTLFLLFNNFLGAPPKFELNKVAQIPVVHNGRVKPLDTVARNSLLFFLEKQTFKFENTTYKPNKWLLTLLVDPEFADLLPVFRINHPGLRETLLMDSKIKTISFEELHSHLENIFFLSQQFSSVSREKQNPFQREVIELSQKIDLYSRLKYSVFGFNTQSFESIIKQFRELKHVSHSILTFKEGDDTTEEQAHLVSLFQIFDAIQVNHVFLPIPLMKSNEWVSYGERVLMELSPTLPINPLVDLYAKLFDSYNSENISQFNETVTQLLDWHKENNTKGRIGSKLEVLFNVISPFYKSILLYGLSLLFLCASFFKWKKSAYETAVYFTFSAFTVHSIGLISRMIIQSRPPVTNLYSSSIFVGWGAIFFCLLLEHKYRNAVGIFISTLIGMTTLIIAHNLSLGGDTLEMMQAVLDSNFWLSTHVITVTIGYSATFIAGGIGLIYVVRGLFTQSLTFSKKKELHDMLLVTVYFGLFFSFVGTVLGGIWADQSWGRFWGWDPKENGALLIVIWNAIIIHARMAGFTREKLMVMAIAGNIITAFSWFGVNLLGVGLHSYGFMEEGFKWLVLFILIQLIFMILGLLPKKYWALSK